MGQSGIRYVEYLARVLLNTRQAIDFRSERASTKTLKYHRQRHLP